MWICWITTQTIHPKKKWNNTERSIIFSWTPSSFLLKDPLMSWINISLPHLYPPTLFFVRVIFAKLFRILDKPNWNFMKRPCGINGQMGLLISTRRHHRIKIASCRYIFVRRIKKSTLNTMRGRWRSNARLMAGSISNLWPQSFPYQEWDRILDAMDQRSQDQGYDIMSMRCVFCKGDVLFIAMCLKDVASSAGSLR